VRAAVHSAAHPFVSLVLGARPTVPQNLHVTVRFLGATRPELVERLHEVLAEAAAPCPAGTVQVRGFGAFPDLRRPRILWAGIDDPAHTIATLERAVTASIAPLGFPPEDRPFHPHVTVARLEGDRRRRRGRSRAPACETARLELPPPSPLGPAFPASHLVLFESVLSPQGPRYSALARFPLAAARAP
jgi:RNA 2',3'-cyclic 3'-phosphodiesterase